VLNTRQHACSSHHIALEANPEKGKDSNRYQDGYTNITKDFHLAKLFQL